MCLFVEVGNNTNELMLFENIESIKGSSFNMWVVSENFSLTADISSPFMLNPSGVPGVAFLLTTGCTGGY